MARHSSGTAASGSARGSASGTRTAPDQGLLCAPPLADREGGTSTATQSPGSEAAPLEDSGRHPARQQDNSIKVVIAAERGIKGASVFRNVLLPLLPPLLLHPQAGLMYNS